MKSIVQWTIELCEAYLAKRPSVNRTDHYPYWRFLPKFEAQIPAGTSMTVKPKEACFSLNIKTEFRNGFIPKIFGHQVRLTIDATGEPSSNQLPCEDNYMLASLGNLQFLHVKKAGQQTIDVTVTDNDARTWDAKTRGIRIFHIYGSTDEQVWSILQTAQMFVSLVGGPSVTEDAAKANLEFLRKYAGVDMQPRTGQINVDIPADIVQDGDFFGLIRLDGLDPMLSWAMGSSTGHTAMALRFNGTLHVVESTSSTNYWKVNGIQKTEFSQWVENYRAADYHIVHLPLSPENAQKFNATAAVDSFTKEYEGVDYGYQNMLWSWVDITKDNFPCLPAEGTVQACLSWPHFEVLVSMMEDFAQSVAELMFLPGLRRRVDLSDDHKWADILKEAYNKFNGDVSKLPESPEQDSWTYMTTRNGKKQEGPARMCDALVCSMWKAGGLFGDIADQVQCTEFTNWDAWGLKLFDPDAKSKRPDVCKAADPDNELCQLAGKYTMQLRTPMYWRNQRPLVAHMAEKCPSMPPKYERPADC
jgi:hypothetical protein